MRKHIQQMPIRKESLLIWDFCLPHGNYPKNSNKMRIIQYLHMTLVADEYLRSFSLFRENLPEILYSFKPWESVIAQNRFQEERNSEV